MRSQQQQQFPDWLEREMRHRGFDKSERGKQAEFARAAGITKGAVTRLLSGEHLPDLRTARALARAFGYPVDDVLIAAGLIEPQDATPKDTPALTKTQHLHALTDGDPAAIEAVTAVLRATGHWP